MARGKIITAFISRIRNSKDFRKSLIYLIASVLGYGIVFIQNFSLAFFLSIDFYGKVSLLISLFSTLYVIFTFGMNAVVLRFYFDPHYASDTRRLTSHVAIVWFLLGLLFIAGLSGSGYILLVVNHFLPLDFYSEFIPVLLGAFLFSFTEIFPNFFIVQDKPVSYAFWLFVSRASTFLFLHLAVFRVGESSQLMAMMLLCSGASVFIVGLFFYPIFPLADFKKAELKSIIKYAFPLMVYALGGIGYSHGYRVIVSNSLSFKDIAVFSMVNQIVMVYYMASSSSVTGLYPKVYKTLESNQGNPRSIRFYFWILLGVGLCFAGLLFPAAYFFLIHFKDGNFATGVEILPILLFGQFVYFIYAYTYALCTFFKKTIILTYAMIAGVSTSLLLAAILLDGSSLIMAAIPVASGLAVQFLVALILVRKWSLNSTGLTHLI